MVLHLIQSREEFGPEERRAELRTVWRMNDAVFADQTHPEGRPTFSEMFRMCKPDRVNCIANSDIAFDETIRLAEDIGPRQAYALSRWDVDPTGAARHWAHCDSADTWVIFGQAERIDVPWPMGTAGVDNRLAWALQQAGYTVTNPSKTIRTFHHHNIAWRSYLNDPSGIARGGKKIFRVPPPYSMVHPCDL